MEEYIITVDVQENVSSNEYIDLYHFYHLILFCIIMIVLKLPSQKNNFFNPLKEIF